MAGTKTYYYDFFQSLRKELNTQEEELIFWAVWQQSRFDCLQSVQLQVYNSPVEFSYATNNQTAAKTLFR